MLTTGIIRWTKPNPAYVATTGTIYNSWRLTYSSIPVLSWRATPKLPPTATVFKNWHLLYHNQDIHWKSLPLGIVCTFNGHFNSNINYFLEGKCEFDGHFNGIIGPTRKITFNGQFNGSINTLPLVIFNGQFDSSFLITLLFCEFNGQFNGYIRIPFNGVPEGCITGDGTLPSPGSSSSNVLVF